MTKKQLLRAIIFLLLFAILFVPVNRVFSRPNHDYNYQMITGFYQEPENSLDAVYIGSSNCFMFWNPLFGWDEFGINVYNFACDSFPFEATAHMIEEARKTQPDALILVNLNTLHDSAIKLHMTHYLVDNMPMSLNRIALTEHLADAAGWTSSETLEFYFPIIRFHSRWNELQMNDFGFKTNGIKGSSTFVEYVNSSSDISQNYHTSDETSVPNEWMMGCVDELLAYCDENDVNILFLVVPRAESEQVIVSQLNYLEDYITDRGYPVLNMINQPEAIGLDLATDFYNNGHANIHGSIKITHHIGQYLMDHYNFQDKRGQEGFESWDKAREKYSRYINPYVLPIEFDVSHRDFALQAPENLTAVRSGEDSVLLNWNASGHAEGYRIYRRLDTGSWECLGDVTDPGFTDTWEDGRSPCYRVVPFRTGEDGQLLFGQFIPEGTCVVSE